LLEFEQENRPFTKLENVMLEQRVFHKYTT